MTGDPSQFAYPQETTPRWKPILLGLVAVLLLVGIFQVFVGRKAKLARMSRVEARLTLAATPYAPLTEIDRLRSPEIYYRVVLKDVPLGWRLGLSCEWFDPSGVIARTNHYETRIIYKSTWTTFCRQQFGESTAAGQWQVRMLLDDRVLSESSFVLK